MSKRILDGQVTEKQLKWIRILEAEYGEEFKGKTKKEASEYLDRWFEHDRKRRQDEMWLSECDHEDAGDRV